MQTYWITKYALSGGISSTSNGEVRGGYLRLKGDWTSYMIGRDAFDNEADAKADAETRRIKKIESLKKQIAKLEKRTF